MVPASIVLRMIAAGMLVGALGRHPYVYYQVLRVVVFAVAAFTSYLAFTAYAQDRGAVWGFWLAGVAVLFNPFLPVYLSRSAWGPIDLAVAGFMVASIFFLRLGDPPPVKPPAAPRRRRSQPSSAPRR